MTELTPLQRRTSALREAHIQQQIGSLALTLAQVMAERDAYAEQNAALMAQIAELQLPATTEGTS